MRIKYVLKRIIILVVLAISVFARVQINVWIDPKAIPAYSKEYIWYYLPHERNKQPLPMEKAKFLSEHSVLFVGKPDEKVVYLTFDDCPENNNIPLILDVLEKHKARATFFMTASYIRDHPEVIRKIVENGSIVGNHTTNHVVVSQLTFEKFQKELHGVEDAYQEATGQQLPKFFRPPRGRFSEASLKYADRMGYTTVFWSFCYRDWNEDRQPSADQVYAAILKELHPGEIMMLHSQSSTNVKALDMIVSALIEKGYAFGSIAEIPCNTPQGSLVG